MKQLAVICSLALFCCGFLLPCYVAAQNKAQVSPKILEQYDGNYQLAPDRFLSLGAFSEVGGLPIFFDSKTRRVGVLHPTSDTEFVSGATVVADSPAVLRVTFVRNERGEVTGLNWSENGARSVFAKRVSPHRNEEITFHNGDVTLHGTLTLPATKGRHPAVIIVDGSGDTHRPSGFWAYFLARHGIAVLTYDKRGAGASTGNWQTAGTTDLANDALAGLQLLRSRADIDPRQVGLWGNSNGGWVVADAVARSKDVAFVISRVGSALAVYGNIAYEVENDLRDHNFTEEEISRAVALRQQLSQAILTNTGWDALRTAIEKSNKERWFNVSRVGWLKLSQIPPDANTLKGWRDPISFDPVPSWERVTCPVLAMFGELDRATDTKHSVPILEAALKKARNKDYTIIVLPKASHGFFEAETGYASEFPRYRGYVSGYMDGMANWLLKRVKVAK